MNITQNQIDSLVGTIKIELTKEDFMPAVDKTMKDYQKKVQIHGFRQGKAPMAMVNKMYGAAVKAEEINKIVGESLNKYIHDNDIQILGEPLPNEDDRKPLSLEDEVMDFVFDIAYAPAVNVAMSKREKVPYYTIIADDEVVNKQIDGIKKNNGTLEDVEDIEGDEYIGGEIIELSDDKKTKKENGIDKHDAHFSLAFVKDEKTIKAFKGKKIGAEVKIDAKKAFPNITDFSSMLGVNKEVAENAGPNFCFIIESIKRHKEAELNEELFTKMYGADVKTEQEFRDRVKSDVEKQFRIHADYRFDVDAKLKMIEKNKDVTLPEEFLKRWILAVNENMTKEQVDTDFVDFKDEFKWQLIKNAIMKEHDLKVELEDVKACAREVAAAQLQQYGLFGLTDEQLDGFATKLIQDKRQSEQLYDRAKDKKVFTCIKDSVKLDEQSIKMDDFEKLFK